MKIMVICNVGMSTSLLVYKMQNVAKERNIEADIIAVSEPESIAMLDQVDIIMLGPQISFAYDEIKKLASPFKTPVMMIAQRDFGNMDGKKVLELAIQELSSKNKRGEMK